VSHFYLDASAVVKRYSLEAGCVWVKALANPTAGHTIVLGEITLAMASARGSQKVISMARYRSIAMDNSAPAARPAFKSSRRLRPWVYRRPAFCRCMNIPPSLFHSARFTASPAMSSRNSGDGGQCCFRGVRQANDVGRLRFIPFTHGPFKRISS
jgi:hypothetical protein